MALAFLVVLAFLAGTVNGETDMNDFIDGLLDLARPEIQKTADPIRLPDDGHSFSQRIVFLTVKGEARVYNGYVYGLTNIHRTGNAHLRQEGENLYITARAGINNLRGQYSGRATFMHLGPRITARLSLSSVSVRMGLRQSMRHGAHPDLYDFTIERISGISVRIDGLGPLGWILGGLTSFIATIFKGAIINAINDPIKNIIRNELQQVSFPPILLDF